MSLCISFLVHTLFYLPCSVYLLSLANALRTKKIMYISFLVHMLILLPSLFGLFAFSHRCFKNEEDSCIIPFLCTHFSTFPVRSICFILSRKHFKKEEGSCIFPFLCTRFSTFPVRSIFLIVQTIFLPLLSHKLTSAKSGRL